MLVKGGPGDPWLGSDTEDGLCCFMQLVFTCLTDGARMTYAALYRMLSVITYYEMTKMNWFHYCNYARPWYTYLRIHSLRAADWPCYHGPPLHQIHINVKDKHQEIVRLSHWFSVHLLHVWWPTFRIMFLNDSSRLRLVKWKCFFIDFVRPSMFLYITWISPITFLLKWHFETKSFVLWYSIDIFATLLKEESLYICDYICIHKQKQKTKIRKKSPLCQVYRPPVVWY